MIEGLIPIELTSLISFLLIVSLLSRINLIQQRKTKEEEETFTKLGCQKGQGYFHHRPQFLEQFMEEF